MTENIEVVALVIAGSLVGVEFAVAAFLNPLVGRLPDAAFVPARADGSRVLGRVMPFWYAATLVALVAVAMVGWPAWPVAVAAALMVLVIAATVIVMVPINNRIGSWSQPADVDRGLSRRWDRLHWVRVGVLVVVYALLAVYAVA
ncbi:anthrone oxygenase family protein [Mycolicibacterium phlei]